jgi:hypothetical protein
MNIDDLQFIEFIETESSQSIWISVQKNPKTTHVYST